MYPPMVLPATVANPPVQIACSSDFVILDRKGRIIRGASLYNATCLFLWVFLMQEGWGYQEEEYFRLFVSFYLFINKLITVYFHPVTSSCNLTISECHSTPMLEQSHGEVVYSISKIYFLNRN